MPRQLLLPLDVQLPVAGTGRDDDRPGEVDVALGDDALGVGGQVHLGHVFGHQLRAEPLGLLAHGVHQVRALDPAGEAGEVLHVGGVHERAASGNRALENERLELGTGGIQRGRVPGGTRSDDDDVVNGAHGLIAFRLTGTGVNRS